MNRIFKKLGPGLLYAGAAVGVSHLVQSTRAGALYGYDLIGIILLVNFFKYPFFETGARYAGSTQKTLLFAYTKMGKPVIYFYLLQTVFTMFIIQATVTIVAAGLLKILFNLTQPDYLFSAIISAFCVLIIYAGKFKSLQNTTKWVVIGLTICTLIALIFAWLNPTNIIENTTNFDFNSPVDILFLVALIGWMPAPVDISVWQSVWRVENKNKVSLRESLTDFHIGYWATAILAVVFVLLGTFVFYNTSTKPADQSVAFAGQLVSIYTSNIGNFAFPIVAFAAFATMFTTCLTCLDANPRVVNEGLKELSIKLNVYNVLLFISAVVAVLIPLISGKSMRYFVDFATTISFLTAPIIASFNYKINFGNYLPKEHQPNIFSKVVAIFGLVFLYLFAFYFLYVRFVK